MAARRVLAPAVTRVMGLVDTAFASAVKPTTTPAQVGALLSLSHEVFEAKAKPIKVLEVGTGSGYLTACIGIMLNERSDGSCVCVVDADSATLEAAQSNVAKAISTDVLSFTVADALLLPPTSTYMEYDLILAGLAAPMVPKQLYDRLTPGGVLVMALGPVEPRGTAGQSLSTVTKGLTTPTPTVNHRRFAGVYPPLQSSAQISAIEGLKGIWF